jgi:hypothetical protein
VPVRSSLRRAWRWVSFATGLVAGCTSLDGLTNGGALADGGSDAAPKDARLSCGDGHWICDDFDGDAALDQRWVVEQVRGRVSVASVDPDTPSPPNSLVVELDPDASPSVGVSRSTAGVQHVGGIRCVVSFRVVSSSHQKAFVFHLGLTGGNGVLAGYFFDVFIESAPKMSVSAADYGSFADGGTVSGPGQELGPLAAGWNTLEVTMRGGPDGGVGAKLNGASAVSTPLARELTTSGQFANASVRLGLEALNNLLPWKVHYDDVVCDLL